MNALDLNQAVALTWGQVIHFFVGGQDRHGDGTGIRYCSRGFSYEGTSRTHLLEAVT